MSSTRSVVGKAASTAVKSARWQQQREGIRLLFGIVGVMWLVEVVNAIDGYALNADGIYPRDFSHLWGILTSPFIHANFVPHLIDNTIPFVFMGVIIALRGARRLAAVTAIVIVLGGLGTWLVAPSGTDTIGASGVVFGYATYLLARGFFDRSALELLTGLIVGVIWGGALLASLVPHTGISWQGHLMGGLAGVVAAWVMATQDSRHRKTPRPRPAVAAGTR